MKAISPQNHLVLAKSLFPRCITLQAARLSRGWSQRHIEELTGINDSYVYQFEQGKCKPWPAAIAKLCAIFEAAQLDLFPELEESSKSSEPPYPPCKSLKVAREKAGLSQHKLAIAADIGIAPAYISAFETGQRKPWPSIAQKLCFYFEVTQDELFPELLTKRMAEVVVWDEEKQECITRIIS